MSKHTPGPWGTEYQVVFDRHNADAICVLHTESDGQFRNCEANAHLIAAAPELLEALELAVKQNQNDMLLTGEELRQCEAVIAKARGEA